jgi:hypothetical protein
MGKIKTLGQDLTARLEELYKIEQQQRSQIISGSYSRRMASDELGVDDPNKREAYAIPLSTLVDLWRTKFGDVWIDVSELEDQFWLDASSRLHRNNLMEEVEFRHSNTPWARLKEGA